MADPAEEALQAALAQREALANDYGQYVATSPIDLNGVRAFNIGDPVPASHVSKFPFLSSQVAKVGNKEALAAAAYVPPPVFAPADPSVPLTGPSSNPGA